MVEVEMKFQVADVATLTTRLTELGARKKEDRREADQYFNAPDRDFARTDEALRLRRIGSSNFITYKGPKRDAQTKTRTEIELRLPDGPEAATDMARLLTHLGYRPVTVVHKNRQIYHLQREGYLLEICLDDLEDLGQFVEIEVKAAEEQIDSARQAVMRLASQLGLKESERRSYLEMLLAHRGEGEAKPT